MSDKPNEKASSSARDRLDDLRSRRARIADGGGRERVEKLHAQGKLSARERIDLLLDPSLIERAKAEFAEKTKGFTYKSAVRDGQKPPLPGKKN